MKSLLRLPLGEVQRRQYIYYRDHDRSLYTWFKARFYMNYSSRLVCFLQDKCVHPHVLTITYGLLGIIGGVLLGIPNRVCVFVGLVVFFTKGILDWADGYLARLQDKVTPLGAKLDALCGKIGTISFYIGVGLYFGHVFNYYAIPYVFVIAFIAKRFGILLGRACVIDSIILIVGVTNIYLHLGLA